MTENYDITKLNFSPGTLVFLDWSCKTDHPIEQQLDNLKEDMMQIEFPEDLILDIGWYPSFDSEGAFQIHIIYKNRWEQPAYNIATRTFADLYIATQVAIGFCKGHLWSVDASHNP